MRAGAGLLALVTATLAAEPVQAQAPVRAVVDRVVVRFYAPETGGSSHPRFISERVLAFEARLEALTDAGAVGPSYQERYVRAALERHIAEEMLSALMVEAGSEPQDLPRQAGEIRRGLAERFGEDALREAAQSEGIDDDELDQMMRRRARAAYYIDRALAPVLHPTEEQLREVYRTSAHPFKRLAFEDARAPLERWFVAERVRLAATAFLQAARSRVKIVVLAR